MDERLALRIRLFREGGRVRPEVAGFVAAELTALAAEGLTVTEETSGMLTSHLMTALTRVLDGEPIAADEADGRLAAELAEHPEAVGRARRIAERAARELGAVLPASEVAFLGMHLAVLSLRTAPAQTDGTTGTTDTTQNGTTGTTGTTDTTDTTESGQVRAAPCGGAGAGGAAG